MALIIMYIFLSFQFLVEDICNISSIIRRVKDCDFIKSNTVSKGQTHTHFCKCMLASNPGLY